MLYDKFNRKIDYLRLAVTDRCNLRCTYCMPSGIIFSPKKSLLSYEEMLFITETLREQDFRKIRITGGEPFARKNIMYFLKQLSHQGFEEIAITTNGVLAGKYLEELHEIGIRRLNLSLDTLNEQKFREITGKDDFKVVMQTFNRMLDLGFELKINCVVLDGINDDELGQFAELSLKHPLSMRFIEKMPFDGLSNKEASDFIGYKIFRNRLLNLFPGLEKIQDPISSSALNYRIVGALGTIGIIPAYSRTFCGSCNRLRITALGELKTCLYENKGMSVRDVIRNNPNDKKALVNLISNAISNKFMDGFEAEKNGSAFDLKQSMSEIGG